MKKCPVAELCGGCQLQHLSYEEQLQLKQEKMEKLFKGFEVQPIIGMSDPTYYRNKVQIAFGKDYHNRIVCGNYISSTHKIVEISDCMIANKKANEILNTIKKLVISFKLSVFDERIMKGLIRHVLIRTGFTTKQIMVVLVTGSPVFPKKNDFIHALLKIHPEITTIVQSVNFRFTSMVLGDRFETLYGKGYIEDTLCGKRFRISPNSFYQVNPIQTEKLYSTAIELAQLNKEEILVDTYCGVGTIGLICADHVKKVLGVEIVKQAIVDAKINAKANKTENIEFVADDAGSYMQKLANRKEQIDVVMMDPARAGADNKFLYALIKLQPKKIVYISCNPITQRENISYLMKKGYRVKKIQPVDMFPYTEHVETVCLLSKLSEAKHHVEVELNADEMEVSSAEKKATYEKIREYVKTKTGLQVTNLYIAQVKRECGIIERENYNIRKATRRMDCLQSDSTTATNLENVNSQGQAKSEDSKQPQCPDEKKKAIKEALIHFGMI